MRGEHYETESSIEVTPTRCNNRSCDRSTDRNHPGMESAPVLRNRWPDPNIRKRRSLFSGSLRYCRSNHCLPGGRMTFVYRKNMVRCNECNIWMYRETRPMHIRKHKERGMKVRDVKANKPTGRSKLQPKAKEALYVVKVCAYCKEWGTYQRGPDGKPWHMDHIIPWAVRPIESLANYVKACHTCNMRKGARRIYPSANTYTAAGKMFGDTWVYEELVQAGEIS